MDAKHVQQPETSHVAPSTTTSTPVRHTARQLITRPPYAKNDPIDIDDYDDASTCNERNIAPHRETTNGEENSRTYSSSRDTPVESKWSLFSSSWGGTHDAQGTKSRHDKNSSSEVIKEKVPEQDGDEVQQWWSFTLPTSYMQRIDRYRQRQSADNESIKTRSEKSLDKDKDTMSLRLSRKFSRRSLFAANQATTPGWESPWQPFSRSPNQSLDNIGADAAGGRSSSRRPATWHDIRHFLLNNPFAPLFFRLLNITVTCATLGVAARIWIIEGRNAVRGIMGRSPLLAIIFAPLTLVHVLTNIYLEYFGRPIGLWPLPLKMFHTLVELVAICLWSSELSLAFDDYFSTALECSRWSITSRFGESLDRNTELDSGEIDRMCTMQASLVGLVFVSLVLYICVLVVSLFRIASRVSSAASSAV